MTWPASLSLFSVLDAAALALLVIGWIAISYLIENPPARYPSVSVLMNRFRRDWMREMVTRQPRLFDSQVLGLMRQGTAFFASGSMLAIGGGLALLGNPDPLVDFAGDLSDVSDHLSLLSAPRLVWEIKLLVILIFLSHAFMKFVWAHRLFGYCAILMAAVPNDASDPIAYPRAAQAAEISITAARAFNKAMRATYFSLASAAWLLGPAPLIVAVILTIAMLWRREFASVSRQALLEGEHPVVSPPQR